MFKDISPYLEPTAAGKTALWAVTTGMKYHYVVVVGYAERDPHSSNQYNSTIIVTLDGEIANYRKSHLDKRDKKWALEGPNGFYNDKLEGLGNVVLGIYKPPT